MNVAELERKLMATARAEPVSERVPYAFEKRIMAQLKAGAAIDEWSLWGRALWRAAAPCVAVMLLLGGWSFLGPGSGTASTDLSQEFENTVLAAVVQEQPSD